MGGPAGRSAPGLGLTWSAGTALPLASSERAVSDLDHIDQRHEDHEVARMAL